MNNNILKEFQKFKNYSYLNKNLDDFNYKCIIDEFRQEKFLKARQDCIEFICKHLILFFKETNLFCDYKEFKSFNNFIHKSTFLFSFSISTLNLDKIEIAAKLENEKYFNISIEFYYPSMKSLLELRMRCSHFNLFSKYERIYIEEDGNHEGFMATKYSGHNSEYHYFYEIILDFIFKIKAYMNLLNYYLLYFSKF